MFKHFHQHIVLIGLSTLLAGFSLASIIFFTDPYSAGVFTHIFFYLSLFLTCIGLFVIAGLVLRQLFFPGLYMAHLGQSFRQALLLSVLITVSMILQGQQLLYWWVEGSLILLLVFVEIFLTLKV